MKLKVYLFKFNIKLAFGSGSGAWYERPKSLKAEIIRPKNAKGRKIRPSIKK